MNPYLVAFLTLPVAAIVAKIFFKWRLSLWIIFFGCVLAGWGLAHLAVQQHFDNLDALVRSTPQPSEALLDALQSDGAAYVFAAYFGWVYAAVYFAVCLWLAYIAKFVVGRFQRDAR
jgi:hypothetical protein